MKRSTMMAIWVGAGVVAAGIAFHSAGYSIPMIFGHPRTLKVYMQDVASKGALSDVAKTVAGHYAGKLGPGFDKGVFQHDMEDCLHRRIGTWLNGTDPRLAQKVTTAGVDALAGEFTTACLKDLAGELR